MRVDRKRRNGLKVNGASLTWIQFSQTILPKKKKMAMTIAH
jgi:hypothetical protein